eukprot:NODE_389_length_1710_cov_369.866346_g308_i0.p1 GENE.NODE_389_length_1710_cov_369.866346_g308_i0~~NODE_389_length_1710_cov_369.866346_g308_i0.p1  ORF type:complete len:536 (-),score=106.60 NODE_389_length_1710_cov_369.866346_g308_i0:101-1645(-)
MLRDSDELLLQPLIADLNYIRRMPGCWKQLPVATRQLIADTQESVSAACLRIKQNRSVVDSAFAVSTSSTTVGLLRYEAPTLSERLNKAVVKPGFRSKDSHHDRLCKTTYSYGSLMATVISLSYMPINGIPKSSYHNYNLLVAGTVIGSILPLIGFLVYRRTSLYLPMVVGLSSIYLQVIMVHLAAGCFNSQIIVLLWAFVPPMASLTLPPAHYHLRRPLLYFAGVILLLFIVFDNLLVNWGVCIEFKDGQWPWWYLMFSRIGAFLCAGFFFVFVALALTNKIVKRELMLHGLLTQSFPKDIANRMLKRVVLNDRRIIADRHEASIMFADLAGFTAASSALDPESLVMHLAHIYSQCDDLCVQHGIEPIKTIGDCYMCAGLHFTNVREACEAIMLMGMAMAGADPYFGDVPLKFRVGINAGPVCAGVIGDLKLSYDLWGDTVNVASRAESTGRPGCVHVTEIVYGFLHSEYVFIPQEQVEMKGKGKVRCYLWEPATNTPQAGTCLIDVDVVDSE